LRMGTQRRERQQRSSEGYGKAKQSLVPLYVVGAALVLLLAAFFSYYMQMLPQTLPVGAYPPKSTAADAKPKPPAAPTLLQRILAFSADHLSTWSSHCRAAPAGSEDADARLDALMNWMLEVPSAQPPAHGSQYLSVRVEGRRLTESWGHRCLDVRRSKN
jgi:hypothetical protein